VTSFARRACSLGALLAGACLPASRVAAPTADGNTARFDWFRYEGRDSVYQVHRAAADEYHNPIIAGFYPDPSIVRVRDDYYLVTSSFSYFPGVPIFHSRDLVNWTQIGHVLDRPSQLALDSAGISRGIFAPAIEYHDGTFYVFTTVVDRGGNFYVTATNPAGPWSDPVWLPEIDGIDPSIYFDDDGKVYVVNNGPPIGTPLYEGHRAIWMQELDVGAKKLIGQRKLIVNGGVDLSKKPIWIEAPHIFKVGGTYILICAEGGTAEDHSEVVLRSDSVWGPYVPYEKNPILTQRHLAADRPFPVTSTGHADFVQTPSGEWWAVFLGVRPYQENFYNTGRETFLLPVRWVDGWPEILTGSATVPYVHRRPSLPRQAPAALPTNGNFAVREDFSDTTLAPYWTFIRTPRERWHDLTTPRGWLTLRARDAHIARRSQPSFIGRRQQHLAASFSTAMVYAPSGAGDRAGLIALQYDDYFFFLGVGWQNGQRVVELRQRAGAQDEVDGRLVASAPLPPPVDRPIQLRIDARGRRYDFSYALEPERWITLARDVDGTILSTKVAEGFTGAMIGMYAYRQKR
jgi:alpha-N-arabinofuranosidase